MAKHAGEATRISGERGSVLPLMLVMVALVAVMGLGLVDVGRMAVLRAEAQSAADVAALAGVVEGRLGAADLAHRNDAELVSFRRVGLVIEVIVERYGVSAKAAATLAEH